MKSVGEAMAIGRNFNEAFQKALRSLETGRSGWETAKRGGAKPAHDAIRQKLVVPGADRVFWIKDAMLGGFSDPEIHRLSGIDPWFLARLRELLGSGKGRPASHRSARG